jgi:hypothetical protein
MTKTALLSRRVTDLPVPQKPDMPRFIYMDLYVDLRARLAQEDDAKKLSQSTEQGQVEDLKKVQEKYRSARDSGEWLERR